MDCGTAPPIFIAPHPEVGLMYRIEDLARQAVKR
jgi:hypothetical protein